MIRDYVELGATNGMPLRMVLRFENYEFGELSSDTEAPTMSGELKLIEGVHPRYWKGIFELEAEGYQEAGYASLFFVATLVMCDPVFHFTDEFGEGPIRVRWEGAFAYNWLSAQSRKALVPFTLIEVL